MKRVQEAFHRLSRVLPACTIRAIEPTIIERASLPSARPAISAARIRSAAVGPLAEAACAATERERGRAPWVASVAAS